MSDAGGSLTVAWTLDKSGNRTQLKWPDAYAVDYAFDGLNRLSAATEDSTSAPLASYSYDPLSRRMSLTYNGGTSSMAYGYTDAGDLTSLSDDLAGTANDVSFTNTFTPAHQLQTATTSNPAYIWTPAAASDAYQPVNNLNQYQSVNGAFLTWDGNGNLLSQNNGAWTYNHDPENRMLRANAIDGSMTMTMENDPEGRRSAKTVRTPDLTITRFLNEGPDEIGEYTQFGGLIRRFIPGAGVDDYVAMELPGTNDGDPGTKTYFHTDRQGSVIAMADSTGALAEGPYTYDAYGNCFVGATTTSCTTVPTTTVPFRYTGQRFDPETGLYYYRARYYCVSLGRFCETDPVGYRPDVNWYTPFGNDPMDNSDPLGLSCTTNEKGAVTGCKFDSATIGTPAQRAAYIKAYTQAIRILQRNPTKQNPVTVNGKTMTITNADLAKNMIGRNLVAGPPTQGGAGAETGVNSEGVMTTTITPAALAGGSVPGIPDIRPSAVSPIDPEKSIERHQMVEGVHEAGFHGSDQEKGVFGDNQTIFKNDPAWNSDHQEPYNKAAAGALGLPSN